MSVNAETVRHVAKLARIAMSDAEVEALVPELNNILGWVEQLAEVDTDGVEPLTAVIDQHLRLRDDAAMLAIAQMPPGVPVACVAVNGARNAAILAARIIDA